MKFSEDILKEFDLEPEGDNKSGTSLRYCVTSFDTFNFEQTQAEKAFLRELLLRNEITHDYFNRELHQQKLIWIMLNCCEGALDVYHDLNEYCTDKNLLTRFADKNLS